MYLVEYLLGMFVAGLTVKLMQLELTDFEYVVVALMLMIIFKLYFL